MFDMKCLNGTFMNLDARMKRVFKKPYWQTSEQKLGNH